MRVGAHSLHCLVIAATLTLMVAGCSSEAPAVLVVGGIGFSETELLGLSPSRRALLGHLTAFAISQSLQDAEQLFEPSIEAEVADLRYRRAEAERLLTGAGIDDAELERRYALAPEWELTIRHLIVLSGRYETATTREAARQKAARALSRIRAGEAFPDVAAEVSEEPGAEGRQGLLNPGREDAWVDEFWEAGLALEVGGISDVVETQYGFHVLQLEDRQPVSFAEARPAVVLRIAEQLGLEAHSTANAPRPGAVTFAPAMAEIADPDAVVAEWADGRIVFGRILVRASIMGGREWDLVISGDVAARGQMLDLELARAEALRIADEIGVAEEEADRVESVREWTLRFDQTGQLLGIPPGLPMAGVKEAALQALGRSGQNADLSRDVVLGWRGLLQLRHRYADMAPSETAFGGTP